MGAPRFKIVPRKNIAPDWIGIWVDLPETLKAGEEYPAHIGDAGAVFAGDPAMGVKPGEFDFVHPHEPGGYTVLDVDTWRVFFANGKRFSIVKLPGRGWCWQDDSPLEASECGGDDLPKCNDTGCCE